MKLSIAVALCGGLVIGMLIPPTHWALGLSAGFLWGLGCGYVGKTYLGE